MILLDSTIVNVALPSLQSELDMSDGDRPWDVTAGLLGFAVASARGGRRTHRAGPRRDHLDDLPVQLELCAAERRHDHGEEQHVHRDADHVSADDGAAARDGEGDSRLVPHEAREHQQEEEQDGGECEGGTYSEQ
ncbi:hypothetical protein [Streptomyces sp. NBC_01591]|uniref:hypothetical protein n=1 Tax=Streptomyces sp. NBC_01591 TaxID=2975888 RepID=UPI002DDBEB16|nr:hypothetical protein [Streptomyces sp. NBC_01591]